MDNYLTQWKYLVLLVIETKVKYQQRVSLAYFLRTYQASNKKRVANFRSGEKIRLFTIRKLVTDLTEFRKLALKLTGECGVQEDNSIHSKPIAHGDGDTEDFCQCK